MLSSAHGFSLLLLVRWVLSASPPHTASLCFSEVLFTFLLTYTDPKRYHYNQFYLWRLFPKLGLIPKSCMDMSLGTHSSRDNVTVPQCRPAWPPQLSELLVPRCLELMTVWPSGWWGEGMTFGLSSGFNSPYFEGLDLFLSKVTHILPSSTFKTYPKQSF